MKDFDERVLRLKLALGLTKDHEIATALGLSKAAFSNRKQLDLFPVDSLFRLQEQRPLMDCVHVLTGKKLEPLPLYLLAAIRCLARAPDVEPEALYQFVDYVEQSQRWAVGSNFNSPTTPTLPAEAGAAPSAR